MAIINEKKKNETKIVNADEEERNIVECEEKEDEEVVNEDGTLNLFSGVSPCVSVSNFRSFFSK